MKMQYQDDDDAAAAEYSTTQMKMNSFDASYTQNLINYERFRKVQRASPLELSTPGIALDSPQSLFGFSKTSVVSPETTPILTASTVNEPSNHYGGFVLKQDGMHLDTRDFNEWSDQSSPAFLPESPIQSLIHRLGLSYLEQENENTGLGLGIQHSQSPSSSFFSFGNVAPALPLLVNHANSGDTLFNHSSTQDNYFSETKIVLSTCGESDNSTSSGGDPAFPPLSKVNKSKSSSKKFKPPKSTTVRSASVPLDENNAIPLANSNKKSKSSTARSSPSATAGSLTIGTASLSKSLPVAVGSVSVSSPVSAASSDGQADALIWKTVMCRSVEDKKPCKFGMKCHFAHSQEELKNSPKKVGCFWGVFFIFFVDFILF